MQMPAVVPGKFTYAVPVQSVAIAQPVAAVAGVQVMVDGLHVVVSPKPRRDHGAQPLTPGFVPGFPCMQLAV